MQPQYLCANLDTKIIDLTKRKKNGQFLTPKQDMVAYLDARVRVCIEGQKYSSIVCHLLKEGIQFEENRDLCSHYKFSSTPLYSF